MDGRSKGEGGRFKFNCHLSPPSLCPVFPFSCPNIQDLQRYSWPGNVRELQHVEERACIVAERGRLRFDHLRDAPSLTPVAIATQTENRILTVTELRDREAQNIRAAVQQSKGKIYGDDGAAAMLGMRPTTIVSRLKALVIKNDRNEDV